MDYGKALVYHLLILLLLIVSLPLQVLIAAAIIVSSGVPVIFRQRRVGKNGRQFVLFKFRTMSVGADRRQHQLNQRNEADGPVFKIRNDPRFTGVGKFLSHTGLDELPQLWNVLKGDMALIGPRPLPVAEVKKLKVWQQQRSSVKPGIISPWILDGYHTKTFDDWMKSDIKYIKQKSILYDTAFFMQFVGFLGRLFVREVRDAFVSALKHYPA